MAFFDWLFGSTDDPQTTTTKQLPSWLSDAAMRVIQEGQRLVSQPYQPYGGARIAPFTGEQNQAFANFQNRFTQNPAGIRTLDAYNRAMGSGRPFNVNELNTYINPYVKQVADNAAREVELSYGKVNQQIGSKAAMMGAFGGSRQGLLESENTKNYGNTISDLYARTFADAWDKGMGALDRQRSAELASGQAGGQLSAVENAQYFGDLNQMLGIGQLKQDMGQRNLDLAYGDFQAQQQYPYQQLSYLTGIMSGNPASQQSTTTQTTSGTNPGFFQQAAGLGIAALGLFR